jgi:hypothetical protein
MCVPLQPAETDYEICQSRALCHMRVCRCERPPLALNAPSNGGMAGLSGKVLAKRARDDYVLSQSVDHPLQLNSPRAPDFVSN